MRTLRILTEEEFLAQNGAGFCFGDAGSHRQPGSTEKSRARVSKILDAKDHKLMALRDKLRKEYAVAVECGKIRPPTRIEGLLAVARGHEDNESTHACRRLLDKRGINWRTE